jgi:hypothetical protein
MYMGGAFLYAYMACPLLIPFRPLMILLAEMIADTCNPLTTSSISSHTLIMISMTHEQRDLSKLPSTYCDHANHLQLSPMNSSQASNTWTMQPSTLWRLFYL